MPNNGPIQSSAAVVYNGIWCLRIPKEAVVTLSNHGLLSVYTICHHNNYYVTPDGLRNEQVMVILNNTPVRPD